MSKHVEYKQGNTVVWSDGDRLTVTNSSGKRHVEQNVDQIFGKGEWDRIWEVKYIEDGQKGSAFASEYKCISGYIPQLVKDDLDKLGAKDYFDNG